MLTTTLLNTTVLFTVCILAITIAGVLSNRLDWLPFAGLQALEMRLSHSRFVIALLCAGAAFGVLSRLYLSYLAPGDILQNTISAQEFAGGRSLYPSNLGGLVEEAITEHPPQEPLSTRFARLKRLQESQFAAARLNLVNAHPPLFSLLMVPLVLASGIYFPAILVNVIALILYGYAIQKITAVLFPGLTRSWQFLFLVLGLGWQPVLASIRHANQSLIVSALVLICWYLLHEKRDGAAGLVLALAICLKIYPCILLLYLIARRHKAFLYAVLSTIAITIFTWCFVGSSAFYNFLATARTVSATFGVARNNASLISTICGTLGVQAGSEAAVILTVVVGVLLGLSVGGLLYLRTSGCANQLRDESVEFSMVTCLICLLSPIVWPHYFSLLLLPVATLAKYGVDWSRPTLQKAALLVLVLPLSVPDQPLYAIARVLEVAFGQSLGWLVSSLQTFAICGILVWLVVLEVRRSRHLNAPFAEAAVVAN